MDKAIMMTIPPPLPMKTRDASQVARQTVSIRTVSPSVSTPITTGSGATVFVGVNAPTADSATTCRRRIPEVQSTNGYEECSDIVKSQQQQRWQHQHLHQQAAHIVKIKINPDGDKNSRVISTVRLTLDGNNCHENENGIACEPCSDKRGDGSVVVSATNLVNERHCENVGTDEEGCVRISVFSDDNSTFVNRERNNNNKSDKHNQDNDVSDDNSNMVHRESTGSLNTSSATLDTGRSSTCFYYNSSYQSPLAGMVISSGQCSPSDTLDSGTCSDLDGTPPPLPKKKNASSTVILSNNTHNRTGSMTSSGAEVDSDDNDSNISYDSLNGMNGTNGMNSDTREFTQTHLRSNKKLTDKSKNIEDTIDDTMKLDQIDDLANGIDEQVEESCSVRHQIATITELGSAPCSPRSSVSISPSQSGTSSLSKASSTPRVRSPVPTTTTTTTTTTIEQNGKSSSSPMIIKECTYEERKQREQQRIERECADAEQDQSVGHKYQYEDDRYYNFHVNGLRDNNKNSNNENGVIDKDECFAGYKIHDKETIRSTKGTVRGVKNRVRAGIATFLQTPISKIYIEREKGKVVLYTTSLGIVRKTFTNCMKIKQMLWTNMVKYEEADLFRDTELQTELRDRTESEIVTLPQLFVDGQYIGGVDTVERLNESGELRRILEPYQCKDACAVCPYCGGFQRLLCPICHGSKRSEHRNEFTMEFVALKCVKCDVFGMIRCPNC